MSVAVKLSDDLVSRARKEGAANGRSVAEQIEFREKLLQAAENHPDVPIGFLREALEAMEDDDALVPYEFVSPQNNDNNQ